jgi:dephospho-CoA kinase
MALFWITGAPGSGKTTICDELQARGYEAYDGDRDNLAHWYSIDTGLPVEKSEEERTLEFTESHSRNITRDVIEDLTKKASRKDIFLCADPENEDDIRDLFAMAFVLFTDESIRKQRLLTRKNNKWGKLPHERERDLRFVERFKVNAKKYNYVVLDSSQPTETIVDQILSEI